jgi:hypothetical protein
MIKLKTGIRTNEEIGIHTRYVDAERCLKILFPYPVSRLSLRTLWSLQSQGLIPVMKVGPRTLFQPDEVLVALERSFNRKAQVYRSICARGVSGIRPRSSHAELAKGLAKQRARQRKGAQTGVALVSSRQQPSKLQ